MCYWLRY